MSPLRTGSNVGVEWRWKFGECYKLHGLYIVRVSSLSSNIFTWNRKLYNSELDSKHCVPLLDN